MIRYYFMDTEIYFQGKRQELRKVEVFSIYELGDGKVNCRDEDGNVYILDRSRIFSEKKMNSLGGAQDV